MALKISIGSDEMGFELKKKIVETFSKKGHEFVDAGTFAGETANYPGIAYKAVKQMTEGDATGAFSYAARGSAWRWPRIRSRGVCRGLPRYLLDRKVDLKQQLQTLCMGALVIGPKTAEKMVELWLELTYDPSAGRRKKCRRSTI